MKKFVFLIWRYVSFCWPSFYLGFITVFITVGFPPPIKKDKSFQFTRLKLFQNFRNQCTSALSFMFGKLDSSNNRRSFVKSSPQIYHTAEVTTEALSPKGTSFPVSCSMPTQQNLLKSHKLNNNHEKASTADTSSLKKLPTQHLTIISRTWNIRFSANQFYNLSLQFRGLNWLWGTEMKPALIGLVVMNKHRPALFLFWLFCMASSRYSLF